MEPQIEMTGYQISPEDRRRAIQRSDIEHVIRASEEGHSPSRDALRMLEKDDPSYENRGYRVHAFGVRNACLIKARQETSSARQDWLDVVNAIAPMTKREMRPFLAKNTVGERTLRVARKVDDMVAARQ